MFYKIPKNLSELDKFRSDPRVQFKEETIGVTEVIVPCYMIADADFWKEEGALELRGHAFRKDTGEMVSAALPKFFNVNENSFTQRADLPWDQVAMVSDKVDGSMITFALVDGKIYAKTKKSFYSDVAIDAQKYINNTEAGAEIRSIAHDYLSNHKSPVFEFCHPEWQIVLSYGDQPVMKFLGYRDMITGKWVPMPIPTPVDMANLEEWQNTATGVEGVVVTFTDGRVVKAKTLWYLQQHRVRTEMRQRDVAELAALEMLDDIKSAVVEAKLDLSKIEVIEKSVSNDLSTIRQSVELIVNQAKDIGISTPKDMAEYCRGHVYFALIMRHYRDQEVPYVDYFLKNVLKEKYVLTNVYNEKF